MRVNAGNGSGSGTLLSLARGRGLIVTNNHVVGRNRAVEVVFVRGGGRFISQQATPVVRGRVVKTSAADDYACIIVDDVPSWAQPIRVDARMPQRGETLYHGGYGVVGSGRGLKITTGRVQSFGGTRGGRNNQFQIGGRSVPGDSGGCVCDADGEYVGWLWGTDGGSTYAVSATCLFGIGRRDRLGVGRDGIVDGNRVGRNEIVERDRVIVNDNELLALLLAYAMQRQQPALPRTIPIQQAPIQQAPAARVGLVDLEARAAIEAMKLRLAEIGDDQGVIRAGVDSNARAIDDLRSSLLVIGGEVEAVKAGQLEIRAEIARMASDVEILGRGQAEIANTLDALASGQGNILENQRKLTTIVGTLSDKQRADMRTVVDLVDKLARQIESR